MGQLVIDREMRDLTRRMFKLEASLTAVAGRLTLAVSNIPRLTTVDISALPASATTTKTATWAVPVLGDYRVLIQPVVAAARLGTIAVGIVAGSKTATSVDIAVVNSAATQLVLGSLDVVIHPA